VLLLNIDEHRRSKPRADCGRNFSKPVKLLMVVAALRSEGF